MRVLIISGSHPRHLYLHREILDCASDCAAIVMDRESTIPDPPPTIYDEDKVLFNKHFGERYGIEKEYFGTTTVSDVFRDIKKIECSPEKLNSSETANFASQFDADIAIIFGTNLIKDPLLSSLPSFSINLHLGLSPWYRGSATLFWPFYFLQPQFCGATFHQIIPEADAGDILHQFATPLQRGDGIHDVGARTVVCARKHLRLLLNGYSNDSWRLKQQKSSGRLFLTRDFQPSHLRLIYSTFNNNIVDSYLDKILEQRPPKLIKSNLIIK